ncbi:hypothetical protein K490DRAFT_60914 [Saccharata proteae CBS 121410]|uniref:Diaminohydroxyphosphoribosylamino-pyrimidine deaminase n=1 Tax=Saccharata proteae CBS 121410 TaxID=1314787 RepID=A0A9P4I2V2_9PEZI|nr:hypothetical protein K490DRAFT_60914 [Saccharata proteae CBS 121410]
MNPFDALLAKLGPEIQDPEEETAVLFSQTLPTATNLGFIDPRASVLEIALPIHRSTSSSPSPSSGPKSHSSSPSTPQSLTLTINQSPTLLTSTLPGGTTGAVVWSVTPHFASFLSSPSNLFFASGILSRRSRVLELGAGVSGVVALAMAPRVKAYVATDMEYVLRLLRRNVAENMETVFASGNGNGPRSGGGRKGGGGGGKAPRVKKQTQTQTQDDTGNVSILPLDWEEDSVEGLAHQLSSSSSTTDPSFDVVLACDCIYNDALIEPFVDTCYNACFLRQQNQGEAESTPTVCIVAQQLRSSEVFEAWLEAFCRKFRCWQVPDEMVPEGLREGRGFVVHVGVVR